MKYEEYRRYLEKRGLVVRVFEIPKGMMEKIEEVSKKYKTTKSAIVVLALLNFFEEMERKWKNVNKVENREKKKEEATTKGGLYNKL